MKKFSKNELIITVVILGLSIAVAWIAFGYDSKTPEQSDQDEPVRINTKEREAGETVTNTSSTIDTGPKHNNPGSDQFHTYYFIGTVLSLNQSTIEVAQGKMKINTGLHEGYKGNVSLVKEQCSVRVGGAYAFRVRYDESKGSYSCENAGKAYYESF